MLMLYIIFISIILCEVQSDRISDAVWRNMQGIVINNINEYCEKKNCVVKCCPNGEGIIIKKRNYTCVTMIKKKITDLYNFTDGYDPSSEMKETSEPVHFVQNEFLSDFNQTYHEIIEDQSNAPILQDGSFNSPYGILNRLEYCVDFQYNRLEGKFYLGFGTPPDEEDPQDEVAIIYLASGMLISAFFMILVLFVYAVLPSLQNIVGMVLMAYLLSLTILYILRGAQFIDMFTAQIIDCSKIDPAIYYFMLASQCWLHIMAFDLWWTLRGSRKCRDIHRRGERIKYLWYSLCAWGIPALMTLILVILDSTDAIADNSYFKPRLDLCFGDTPATTIYVHGPIGILTTINCILFGLTVYNIWLIRRGIATSKDSSNTKNNENRSKIYGKLLILMGVTWILELIPTRTLAAYIIVDAANIFVGVTIFYIFVCKKSIIIMLCKRFNLKCSYVERLNRSKTQTTSSVNGKSYKSRKNRDEETEVSTYTTKDYDATEEVNNTMSL